MAILEIVNYPDQRLREECEDITEFNQEIKTLAENMAETMYDAPGVGLAGPQVGVLKNIIVLDQYSGSEENDNQLLTLINPKIVKAEGEKVKSEEGCLSIPGLKETIKRFEKVKVNAKDIDGKDIEIEADEFLSIILQHEIDHLNGVLFIDHLSKLKQRLVKAKIKKANGS